jgi:hypothetical protein
MSSGCPKYTRRNAQVEDDSEFFVLRVYPPLPARRAAAGVLSAAADKLW